MIDVKKYFIGEYVKGDCDCWTLLQDIYLEHHGIKLPDFPISGLKEDEYASHLVNNLVLEEIKEPEVGCIVHKSCGIIEHVGYNLDNRYYIHRTKAGTRCDRISQAKCVFYKVLSVS